ncbi:class I SAM-dependent methyltransferase [Roseimaritima ulvae]|uniref:Bifunctional 3-demethylubiquinone-9 3-methyltransferase/ 2-octaprenyl-6-hydroxy phenol methylase n=1 Tax=Roseimaritima ulvae TaxID=980254 RepID=A0A5B9QTV9_9BACT|nr:class I SAM-dependent methyltransferase [Roseimaritima ulvae]QEG42487.1 bifunctional 3-demethylubiquinone-9 3-methyltransferase/ 2-octaprenyl-6-hydroxy phenol methylase [Roseimaritima ulvae]
MKLRSMLHSMLRTPPRPGEQPPRSKHHGLRGWMALELLLHQCEFDSVLDVGSGAGEHAEIFERKGKTVTCIDFGVSVYYAPKTTARTEIIADYYQHDFKTQFDLVWACHVLEHQPNANLFLRKLHSDCREGGWIAITVPPLKHNIVGGHVSLWNGGLLLYQMVLAGFNCRHASVKQYAYNISVVVKKQTIHDLPPLHYDKGDVERLRDFFPDALTEGFDGNISELNWPMHT